MFSFDYIEIEGFGSILRPFKYRLDTIGLNILKGGIGVGKTTIIDALMWCLYGIKTKKKSTVEPWPQIVDSEYKGVRVTTVFRKDGVKHELTRCLNYQGKILGKAGKNRLILLIDGKEDNTSKKQNIKTELIRILGYSPELFRSTILFGQQVDKFIQEDSATKKKILEDAFSMVYISKAIEIARKKEAQLSKERANLYLEVVKAEGQYELWKNTYTIEKKNANKNKRDNKAIKEKIKAKIKDIKAKIKDKKEIQNELEEVKSEIARISDKIENTKVKYSLKDKLDQVNNQFNLKSLELSQVNEQIKDIRKAGNICTACGQKTDKNKKLLVELKSKAQNLGGLCKALNKKSINLRDKINASNKKVLNKVSALKAALKILEDSKEFHIGKLNTIITLESNLKYLKEEINALKSFKKVNLNKIKEKVGLAYQDYLQLSNQLKPLDNQLADVRWLIKEPLSNSGLKAFIFDTMLARLNNELLRYKKYLGFTITIGINMNSAHKDVIVSIKKNGDEIPIADLSGGQKQLSNLAIGLSFHNIQTRNNPMSILILDECFEGLNEEGIQVVYDLLMEIAKTKSIHLVTHRSFNPLNAQVVELGLTAKGTTEIITKYRNS